MIITPSPPKTFMDNLEILLNEKKEYVIADRKYYLGKLSISQFLKIIKFVTKTIITSQKRINQLKEVSQNNETIKEDVLTIFELLDNDEVIQFFSIVLNETDLEFLNQNLSIDKALEIIDIELDFNIDLIENSKKKFNQIQEKIQRIMKK